LNAAQPTAATSAGASTSVASPATVSGSTKTFRIVPAQSEASYDVQEQFLNQPLPSRAVGKTSTISGDFQLGTSGSTPQLQSNRFTVDLRTLESDQRRRDQFIREQWLESNRYPNAEFVATSIEQAPAQVVDGQPVSVKISGNMTIHDTTKPVTFDTQATVNGNTITGTATTFLLMRDFGFDPPEVLGVLKVQDGVNLTVRFTAQAT
jgi:polyisoprenoid-binding protein YceI